MPCVPEGKREKKVLRFEPLRDLKLEPSAAPMVMVGRGGGGCVTAGVEILSCMVVRSRL